MSKYNQGYLGAQIGKLGNAVGRRWKGRNFDLGRLLPLGKSKKKAPRMRCSYRKWRRPTFPQESRKSSAEPCLHELCRDEGT